jgi:hypothetical protein
MTTPMGLEQVTSKTAAAGRVYYDAYRLRAGPR